MSRKIIIIIEDDEPTTPEFVPAVRRDLYRRLDEAQRRANDAADWIASCACNPANGGSGVCGCVNPYNQVWC